MDTAQKKRTFLARLSVGTVVIAVAMTGATAPAAKAVEAGDYLVETIVVSDPGNANSIAIDSHGNIYATFADSTVRKFDSDGKPLLTWGDFGTGDGQFSVPYGIAIDPFDNVYVADAFNHDVQKFTRSGKFLYRLGTKGSGDGQFQGPRGLAIDPTGFLYVADLGNHRIQKFDLTGKFVLKWGVEGGFFGNEMKVPQGVAVDKDHNVYVADTGNDRVTKFDQNGTFLLGWGKTGKGNGEFEFPTGVATDRNGDVFVTDQTQGRVQKFHGNNAYITQWGNSDLFPNLRRLAVAPDGRVYTADNYNIVASRQATGAVFTAGPRSVWTLGRAYASELRATGFPAVSAFAVVNGSLPPGLKRVGNRIEGVPTQLGSYEATLKADNSVTPTTTKNYTIRIDKAPTRVSALLSTKRPRVTSTKIRAVVRLSVPNTAGLSRTGKLRVYYGTKAVKTLTLYKAYGGRVKVSLPKFTKKGKTKVTIRYFGNSQLKSSRYTTYVRVR